MKSVTNPQILRTIAMAKKEFGGLIIAGKMHGAGTRRPVIDWEAVHAASPVR